MGIEPDHIFVLDNGDTLEMRDHKVKIGQPVESGVVYVDGMRVSDADPVVLRDRQKLSNDGIVTCVVTVNARTHKALEVDVSARGVSFADDGDVINGAQDAVRATVDRASEKAGWTVDASRRAVRNSLSNYLWQATHTKPMIVPVVMEV